MSPRGPRPEGDETDESADAEAGGSRAIDATTLTHDVAAIRAAHRSAEGDRECRLLLGMRGPFVGRVVPLGSNPCRLGRDQGSDCWLPDAGVSRNHARIDKMADHHVITDVGSSNGTFVNGERVVEPTRLHDGDLVQLGGLVSLRFQVTDAEGMRVLANLYEASVKDPLTGSYNREYLHERLAAEVAFAGRHGTQLCVVMFDLDHFKRVNDTHGHPAGDQVLVAVSSTVRASIRLEDVLVRYGGEEFLLILRDVPIDGARALAERIRTRVEALRFPSDRGTFGVTASFGCASLDCTVERNAARLVGTADRRLFAAKHLGRNCVVAHD